MNSEKIIKKANFMVTKNKGILAQQHYIPIYNFSVYKEKKTFLTNSEKYYKNSVSIPIYVNLSSKDQNKVIKIIKKYFD